MNYLQLVYFAAAVAIAGCNQDVADHQALQGEWAVVAMGTHDVSASDEELRGMRWSIKGNEITGSQPAGTGKMSFTLNPEQSPKTIDVIALDGDMQGKIERGIYQLEAGRLRIGFLNRVGDESIRPVRFAEPSGWEMTLEKFTR